MLVGPGDLIGLTSAVEISGAWSGSSWGNRSTGPPPYRRWTVRPAGGPARAYELTRTGPAANWLRLRSFGQTGEEPQDHQRRPPAALHFGHERHQRDGSDEHAPGSQQRQRQTNQSGPGNGHSSPNEDCVGCLNFQHGERPRLRRSVSPDHTWRTPRGRRLARGSASRAVSLDNRAADLSVDVEVSVTSPATQVSGFPCGGLRLGNPGEELEAGGSPSWVYDSLGRHPCSESYTLRTLQEPRDGPLTRGADDLPDAPFATVATSVAIPVRACLCGPKGHGSRVGQIGRKLSDPLQFSSPWVRNVFHRRRV